MSLLRKIWYWLQKLPKSAPRTIFDKYSVHYSFYYSPNFYLYFPKLLFESKYINLCLLRNGYKFLRHKCLYLEWSGIGCKKHQRDPSKPFLKSYSVLLVLLLETNVLLLLADLLSEWTNMNCTSSSRATKSLEISAST